MRVLSKLDMSNNSIENARFELVPTIPNGVEANIVKIGASGALVDSGASISEVGGGGGDMSNYYTKTEVDQKLTGGMHYKGSVQTTADLPASGAEVGDFYNVVATGENWAWDGAAWDQVGSIVDLQPITNAEIDFIVAS